MSPTEDDLRAALRHGEGDGVDVDRLIAGAPGAAPAARVRIGGDRRRGRSWPPRATGTRAARSATATAPTSTTAARVARRRAATRSAAGRAAGRAPAAGRRASSAARATRPPSPARHRCRASCCPAAAARASSAPADRCSRSRSSTLVVCAYARAGAVRRRPPTGSSLTGAPARSSWPTAWRTRPRRRTADLPARNGPARAAITRCIGVTAGGGHAAHRHRRTRRAARARRTDHQRHRGALQLDTAAAAELALDAIRGTPVPLRPVRAAEVAARRGSAGRAAAAGRCRRGRSAAPTRTP